MRARMQQPLETRYRGLILAFKAPKPRQNSDAAIYRMRGGHYGSPQRIECT